MTDEGAVSVIIPCYNPREFLLDAIRSARAQTRPVEIVLVDDGSTEPRSRPILQAARAQVDLYIKQPNGGVSSARNAAIEAAHGDLIVPLDSDDLLHPRYVERCSFELDQHPGAAFVYTDYHIVGNRKGIERLPDYNLYTLLDRNILPYAALYRKKDWRAAGGYDVAFAGYEDWEFWIRLGSIGRFGRRIAEPLFSYRKHGPSLFDSARAENDHHIARIRRKHARLYSDSSRIEIKRRWSPAVCFVNGAPAVQQSIADWRDGMDGRGTCTAYVEAGPDATAHTAEYAALAIWSGRRHVLLADGSVAAASPDLTGRSVPETIAPARSNHSGPALMQHLQNAGLLSVKQWREHPLQSASRLIPLRIKEAVNRLAGRELFDLTFYLQFQTYSLVLNGALVTPLEYIPRGTGKRRVAFVTPHFGVGGAEAVMLDMAASLDRTRFEILALATHSTDDSWLDDWRRCADHTYDLMTLCSAAKVPAALITVLVNWSVEAVAIQNSLAAYSAVPHLKQRLRRARLMDIVHSVGDRFDVPTVTRPVADSLDLRVAVSDAARQHLLSPGVRADRITVVRAGVDVEHFSPVAREDKTCRILFAGRLDPVKRPFLVPAIASALRARGASGFRFVIAGDGPERQSLERTARTRNVRDTFEFLGYVDDLAPVVGRCDILLVTSANEGIPLVVLEAMASGCAVVASPAGAIAEAVTPDTGVLVERGTDEAARFAAALHQLILDPARRRRMGLNGRAFVQARYNIQNARDSYRALFEPVTV